MSSVTDQQPRVDSNQADVEKEQEAKLRQKYPGLRGPGPASILQKRLSRGQKYFDSGDYNMAKAKQAMPPPSQPFKPAKSHVVEAAPSPPVIQPVSPMTDATGDTIPTPETLAIRKPSLIVSKLVSENPS